MYMYMYILQLQCICGGIPTCTCTCIYVHVEEKVWYTYMYMYMWHMHVHVHAGADPGGGFVGLQPPQSTRQPTQNQGKQQRSAGARRARTVYAYARASAKKFDSAAARAAH